MDVVPTPASPVLSRRIAKSLNLQLASVTCKKFPDGEIYVRVESDEAEHVIVCSINKNDDLVTLLLMLDALVGDCYVVIPYMGYARQDKAFLKGEAISIRAIAKLIESYTKEIYTVNIHSQEAASFFKNLKEIDAMPEIGKKFVDEDVIMISPDEGSIKRVKVAAKFANCDWDYLEKRRIDSTTVEITPKNLEVANRDIVIVDDIISTGGTIIQAAKMLRKLGARNINAACVHGVFAAYSVVSLFSSGISEIIATDTVESIFSKISVSELISKELANLIR